jgi:para-nitrobenzyl esterase
MLTVAQHDLAACTPPRCAAATADPVVDTALGALRGRAVDGVERFLAVPYAAPPVGDLRWRPAHPAAPWGGLRDAGAHRFDAPQNRPWWERTASQQPTSEDCLTLDVCRPAGTLAGARLPVLVWIHGGGFVMGSNSQPAFDGTAWAREGLLFVALNYRLGRVGFFTHPALHHEGAGNWGLGDQAAALQWLQQHLEAFGGDPGNVTLFGESAGGQSVLALMLAPEARGLFHRAIVQSAAARQPLATVSEALACGEAFARHCGLKQPDPQALRALPLRKLVGSLDLVTPERGRFSGPMLDGRWLPRLPLTAMASPPHPLVPLIVGSTSDELGQLPWMLARRLRREALAGLRSDRRTLEDAYGGPAGFKAHFVSDHLFVEPARELARRARAAGAPVWHYRFDCVPAAEGARGARHTLELPYLFDRFEAAGLQAGTEDRRDGDRLRALWVAFARDGRPEAPQQPRWPRYDGGDQVFCFRPGGTARVPERRAVLDAITRAHPPDPG